MWRERIVEPIYMSQLDWSMWDSLLNGTQVEFNLMLAFEWDGKRLFKNIDDYDY